MSIANLFVANTFTLFFNKIMTTNNDILVEQDVLSTIDNTPTLILTYHVVPGDVVLFGPQVFGRNTANIDVALLGLTLSSDGTNAGTSILNNSSFTQGTMAGVTISHTVDDPTHIISLFVSGLNLVNINWKVNNQVIIFN